jgi:KDO2-lipid IV(A) lauroyltransferase
MQAQDETGNVRTLRHLAQFLPIWLLMTVTRIIPFSKRGRVIGRVLELVAAGVPPFRRRAERNLALVFPDMPPGERRRIAIEVAGTVGATLSEILNNDLFAKAAGDISFGGPGFDALKRARAEGKGAIIVSAHFGQWEAIRHVLKLHGMETGAVYKPNRNRFYENLHLPAIKQAGEPIVENGAAGMMKTVRHVRSGGFFAILTDQRFVKGVQLPFMGRPAWTSLAAAELALKYGLPLVPAYATRGPDGLVHVDFEDPIVAKDATDAMKQVLQSLEARVRKTPGQWYWYHNRWAG